VSPKLAVMHSHFAPGSPSAVNQGPKQNGMQAKTVLPSLQHNIKRPRDGPVGVTCSIGGLLLVFVVLVQGELQRLAAVGARNGAGL